MRLVRIEYTEDVQAHAGIEDPATSKTIPAGTQRLVDENSARSLVEVRKVAKLVDDKKPAAEPAPNPPVVKPVPVKGDG